MISRHARFSVLALCVLCITIVLSSCSKKDVKMEEPIMDPSAGDAAAAAPSAPVDSGISAGDVGAEATELQTVYFEYDRFTLTGAGKDSLKTNAKWLKNNASARIQIEGHCDERGTTQYNLALGERRANAVREFMGRMGVAKERMDVVSYGEERPADPGHDDAAWGKNRRATFVITSR